MIKEAKEIVWTVALDGIKRHFEMMPGYIVHCTTINSVLIRNPDNHLFEVKIDVDHRGLIQTIPSKPS